MPLTDTQIKKAKPGNVAYRMSDAGGLFLFVTTAGGKLWRWKYRFDGREKLMAFGQYPDVSLAEARERHANGRRILASGTDPMAVRKSEKSARREAGENTFSAVASLWLDHWRVDKSSQHVNATQNRLRINVFPTIGSRPITAIQPTEVVAMVKTIEARGAADLAKRSFQTSGQIFRYAIAHGYAQRNPCAEIKPSDILKPVKKVNLARVDAKDLPALLRAIEVYRGKAITRLAMKLLAMTFVRTSELIGARWAEFDMKATRWKIPAERMKMDSPHIVPLSTQAVEILELLRPLTGACELLFPGEQDARKPMSNNTILTALDRMGYRGRQTGHGFRGIASTILHEQGYDHQHIELQLAHAPRDAVAAAYNHALYLEPRTRMMQDWSNFLEETQRKGKVLPFRRQHIA